MEELSHDGMLSKEKVLAVDAGYGLQWFVIRWQVAAAVPGLPLLNAGHGTERKQTKIQSLLQVHGLAMQHHKATGYFKWDQVASAIEKSKPELAGQLGDLCAFVSKWGGGSDAMFLRDRDEFSKSLSKKDVPSQVFRMLANCDFVVNGPEFIVKAQGWA